MTTTHKGNDYKLNAVEYYLIEDKSQVEVCEIFKCSPRSLMRWIDMYKKMVKLKDMIKYQLRIRFIKNM